MIRRPARLFRNRPPRPEPHVAPVLDLVEREQLHSKPGFHHIIVEHDKHCRRPQGKPCTCAPRAFLAPPTGAN